MGGLFILVDTCGQDKQAEHIELMTKIPMKTFQNTVLHKTAKMRPQAILSYINANALIRPHADNRSALTP